MRRTQRLSYFTAVLFLVAGQIVVAPAAHAEGDFDWYILLVGNSLVRGIRRPLDKIFEAQGQSARIRASAPAIQDLQYHARSGRTQRIIDSQPWDVVFLQEKSPGPAAAGGGYQAVRDLHQKIQSVGAQTLMFMSWRERDINPLGFEWDLLKGDPGGTIGYVPIASELGIGVAPVGWAIRQARLEMGEPPPWDLWKGAKGRHLSDPAQYLAACVVYSVLTGGSPRGLWAPENLPLQTADFLQTVAETVMTDTAAWNMLGNN